jgi:hypothetical protein
MRNNIVTIIINIVIINIIIIIITIDISQVFSNFWAENDFKAPCAPKNNVCHFMKSFLRKRSANAPK